jgi:hypothetical protein
MLESQHVRQGSVDEQVLQPVLQAAVKLDLELIIFDY